MTTNRRLEVLSRQLAQQGIADAPDIAPSVCSGAVRTLPRFDPYIMETYLDDLRELKKQVYDLFKYKPELLPQVEEGMSKGGLRCCHCMVTHMAVVADTRVSCIIPHLIAPSCSNNGIGPLMPST
jgi:hypothetical protein